MTTNEPTSPAERFARAIHERVLAHQDHGGWYETDDGLHCAEDDELVIPTVHYEDDCGRPVKPLEEDHGPS